MRSNIRGSRIMNTRHWLLYVGLSLFICLGPISSLPAQERPATETLPQIIKRIRPSTVVVLTYDEKGKPIALGSGFFVSRAGHIITNRHVLEGASRAEIKTAQGKIHSITHILAEDKEGDLVLASVDIPPGSVQPLKLSDSIPQVGQKIIVIGNPLGLEGTVSDGIVSAVRDIPAFGKIIQISAPISPGSSGSPVVDMKGQVIGIATFGIGEDQEHNFAIPSQRAAKLKPSKSITLAEWKKLTGNKNLVWAEKDYRKGLVYLWSEDYKKALLLFKKAVEKNLNYGDAWFYIGNCNVKLDRYDDAVAAYKQAIRITLTSVTPEVHTNLGVTYSKLGRHSEAIEIYKQAIHVNPDDAKAHYSLGLAYSKLGRFTEEIAAYKQAIHIKADYADAHCNLGVVYGKLGRDVEAIKAYKQAIRVKADFAEAYVNLGLAYLKLDRHAEAVTAFKQAIRIKPDFAKTYVALGVAYANLGGHTKAIKVYKQALRIEPDYADAHCNLGLAYGKLGRFTEEIVAYKQAIRIKPDFANAHHNLGLAYGKLERYAEAVEAFKQAICIKPDLAQAHCNLGVVYFKLGRFDGAVVAFKQAIRIKPDNAVAHSNLGEAYFELGDKDSALEEYRILKDLDKDRANELLNLINK